MALGERLTALGDRIADRSNPIVLRELRQLVRSRFVVAMIVLVLLVLLAMSGFVMMTQIAEQARNGVDLEQGRTLFGILFSVLCVAGLLFVPLYVSIRFGIERSVKGFDLMYISTISPWRVVTGKMLSAVQLLVLLLSAGMPFLVFTYLLRGVDLMTVFILVICLFGWVLLGTQLLLLFAALPLSRVFRAVVALFIAGGWFTFFLSMPIALAFSLMSEGIGSMVRTQEFWSVAAVCVTTWAAGLGSAFVLTGALVSPPAANRAVPVRIYHLVAWLVGVAVALFVFWLESSLEEGLMIVGGMSIAIWCIALACSSGCSDVRSYRVQKQIPRSRAARFFGFPFYAGRVNALAWAVVPLVLSLCMLNGGMVLEVHYVNEELMIGPVFVLYTVGYCLTAILIQRKSWLRAKHAITPLVAALLLLVVMIVPYLVAFMVRFGGDWGDIWMLLSPLDPNLDDHAEMHLMAGVVWVFVMLMLNARWVVMGIGSFRRAEPPPPLPGGAEGTLAPVETVEA